MSGAMGRQMSGARFAHLLDAYGADLRRWPAKERAGALDLLAQSEGARAAWVAAKQLDRWLDQPPPGLEADHGRYAATRLSDRLAVAAAQPGSRQRPWLARLRESQLWAGLGAAAAAAVIVLAVGSLDTTAPTPDVAGLVISDASLADLGL